MAAQRPIIPGADTCWPNSQQPPTHQMPRPPPLHLHHLVPFQIKLPFDVVVAEQEESHKHKSKRKKERISSRVVAATACRNAGPFRSLSFPSIRSELLCTHAHYPCMWQEDVDIEYTKDGMSSRIAGTHRLRSVLSLRDNV